MLRWHFPLEKALRNRLHESAQTFSCSHGTVLRQLNKVQGETRHGHKHKGHQPMPAMGLPRCQLQPLGWTNMVCSGIQEVSSHRRVPVPFVMPCSVDGHTWATQSTYIDLFRKMGQSECLCNNSTKRGGERQCKMFQQQPINLHPG